VLVLGLGALLPATAQGAATAKMSARFTPEHLGAGTTVSFAFQVGKVGRAPPALSAVSIAYPRNLGLATSGLGLASCSAHRLKLLGPASCPPNSHMGSGSARIELPIGESLVHETVSLSLVAGPSRDGYLHLLIYASGATPVEAVVVLSAVLLPGRLRIVVPPIPLSVSDCCWTGAGAGASCAGASCGCSACGRKGLLGCVAATLTAGIAASATATATIAAIRPMRRA